METLNQNFFEKNKKTTQTSKGKGGSKEKLRFRDG